MADGTRLLRFEANDKTLNLTFLQNWNDNFGDLVTRTGRLPGMTGGFDELGSGAAPGEVGTISASFALVAETKAAMTAQLDDLRAIAEWNKGKLYMQSADPTEGERWCWARLNTITTTHNYERHTDLFMRVQATWQVAYPRWERVAVGEQAARFDDGVTVFDGAALFDGSFASVGNPYYAPTFFDDGVAVFDGGGYYDPPISATSTTLNFTNEGNAAALLRLVLGVVVNCPGGIIVERMLGGVAVERISLSSSSAGQTWAVDGRRLSVQRDGQDAYDGFSADTPRWLTLAPGANSLKVTFPAGGGARLRAIYNHTWI